MITMVLSMEHETTVVALDIIPSNSLILLCPDLALVSLLFSWNMLYDLDKEET